MPWTTVVFEPNKFLLLVSSLGVTSSLFQKAVYLGPYTIIIHSYWSVCLLVCLSYCLSVIRTSNKKPSYR